MDITWTKDITFMYMYMYMYMYIRMYMSIINNTKVLFFRVMSLWNWAIWDVRQGLDIKQEERDGCLRLGWELSGPRDVFRISLCSLLKPSQSLGLHLFVVTSHSSENLFLFRHMGNRGDRVEFWVV